MARIVRREVYRRGRLYGVARFLFVVVVLIGAVDVITLQNKIASLKSGAGGLAQLAIGVAGQSRVMETLTFWGVIAAVLGVLMLLTRGQRVLIEESEEADDGADSLPRKPPPRQLVRRA